VVATGCNRSQIQRPQESQKHAKTVAMRCDQLHLERMVRGSFLGFGVPSGRLPECSGMSLDERRYASYECGSTSLVTTQRCLPILRSRTNPSLSYVDRAPWKRKPAGTEPASSG
jgi:hypothetical protein